MDDTREGAEVRIVVCVKQVVVDPQPHLAFLDGDIDPDYATFELNEADLYAVEEALRQCETAGQGDVTVVTVGNDRAERILHRCLSMGATRAVRVWSEALSMHDPIAIARALGTVVRAEAPDMVLCGVQSSDSAQQATGPALAGVLGWPCVSAVTKVEINQGRTTVHHEVNGGLIEVVELDLPAVCTVQTGLNTPRYGSFKQLMQAKRTPIAVCDPGDTGSRTRVRGMSQTQPSVKRAQMIEGSPAEVAKRIIELVRANA